MALRVGMVGCGNISNIYFGNARHFSDFDIVACADLRPETAAAQGARYGAEAMSTDRLLADPGIDAVLNLTVPEVHAEVSLAALSAGKHVYGEKPLATDRGDGYRIVDEAERRGLRVGCAPDTVLGPGIQLSRALVADGEIGEPVTGLAAFLSHGMEHWHPNPDFFFKPGAGPMLDIGPYYVSALTTILGPVAKVRATGRIGSSSRTITADGPNKGKEIRVETLTTLNGLLSFAGGAEVVIMMSWDVWNSQVRPIEIHGTRASLRIPDPNWFGGVIELSRGGAEWAPQSTAGHIFGTDNFEIFGGRFPNYRGLGLAEMARAISEDRPHRCSGAFALHTLDVMLGVIEAATEDREVSIKSALPVSAALDEAQSRRLVAGSSAWQGQAV